MTRESTSRPCSSVPKRCATPGGVRYAAKSSPFGAYGETTGAKIAARKTASTMTAPASPARLRRRRRTKIARRPAGARAGRDAALLPEAIRSVLIALLLIVNARIEPRIRNVDRQVEQDVGQ